MAKNFLLVLFGILISLICLELIFRISALFLNPGKIKINEKAYRILCVGDSSTYGTGASDRTRFSYPSLLEEMLTKVNQRPVQVINMGLPGINSSQALNLFEKRFEETRPDLVLVCVGINDPWNLEQSRILEYYDTGFARRFLLRLILCAERLKTVRFLKLVFLSGGFEPVPDFDKKTVMKNTRLLPEEAEFEKALARCLESNLKAFQESATRKGAQIYFLEYHAPGWRDPQLILHALYKKIGVNVIPVYDFFQKLDSENRSIRSFDHWHLNNLGYKLLSKMICSHLHEKLPILVPDFKLDTENLKD